MTAVYLAAVALAALLSENFILVNCLGIGTRTRAFEDPRDAIRTGVSLTAVMTFTALVAWAADQLLCHFGLDYFQTLVFALIGPVVVWALRSFLRSCVPELSRRLDENLASITSNCAAMGAALILSQRGYNLAAALLFGLFGGLGAAIALVSFAGLRQDLNVDSCPKSFRGLPLELITAGLMALSLVGFYGLNLS